MYVAYLVSEPSGIETRNFYVENQVRRKLEERREKLLDRQAVY